MDMFMLILAAIIGVLIAAFGAYLMIVMAGMSDPFPTRVIVMLFLMAEIALAFGVGVSWFALGRLGL